MPLDSPRNLVVLLALAAGVALPAVARQADTAQLQRDVESALLALGDRDALGPSDTPLTVGAPAQVRYEIGAVVVPRADGGPAVMAVTPGGAAARMRLQPGDRLVSVNGRPLAGLPDPVSTLQSAIAAKAGAVRVEYQRAGEHRVAAGTADIVAIPAYRLVVGASDAGVCDGYVSDSVGKPPRSHFVFPAQVTRIDGRSTPLSARNRHRLEPGRHVLTVRELINDPWVGPVQRLRISHMLRVEGARAYKPLVLDVKPGTTYRIGARLLRDRLDAGGIRANAYWEPVVWAEHAGPCD